MDGALHSGLDNGRGETFQITDNINNNNDID